MANRSSAPVIRRFSQPKVGVLLLNLGTPDATDYWSVRRYLGEFLSDRRVIETNPLIWQPILQGIILSVRPQKSGANYERIWDKASQRQPAAGDHPAADRRSCRRGWADVVVEYAHALRQPVDRRRALKALQAAGCQKILSGAALSAIFGDDDGDGQRQGVRRAEDSCAGSRRCGRCRPISMSRTISRRWREHRRWRGGAGLHARRDPHLVSRHADEVPEAGDPYHCQCLKTTRLVREYLGWPEDKLMVTFQSRFGPTEWLQPYTDATLKALPGQGKKKVAVVAPAFSVDCIETLEEIAITGREQFEHAGGEHYAYIPCLNDSDGGMEMLETVVRKELQGWI